MFTGVHVTLRYVTLRYSCLISVKLESAQQIFETLKYQV